jgi:N-methylhydantoinase B
MATDKIRLEILSNRFQAVVDEMAQVVSRTAHTVFVKETQDYVEYCDSIQHDH